MADMLQKYLASGLLDIGDDDTRLTKLREASADLQKLFASAPRVGLYHALMVFSDKVDVTDACFTESAEALSKYWNTYANKYKDPPRGLFRAMAIHAVSETSDKSPDFTAAVAYGLRSLGQHPRTTNEGTILEEYYRDITHKLEERAVASWRLNSTSPVPALKVPSVTAPAVEKATLDQGVNPDTVTTTLTKLAGGIVSDVNKNLKALSDGVSTGMGAMQQGVRELCASSFHRSELLWWKESRYSPILKRSYRGLPRGVVTVFMALDVHSQIPGISPLTVDFFLREAVREILGGDHRMAWGELVADVSSDNLLRDAFIRNSPEFSPRHGVRTLIENLREEVVTRDSGGKPPKAAAKSAKEPGFDLGDLAVSVYLALQALRFSPEKADGKKV